MSRRAAFLLPLLLAAACRPWWVAGDFGPEKMTAAQRGAFVRLEHAADGLRENILHGPASADVLYFGQLTEAAAAFRGADAGRSFSPAAEVFLADYFRRRIARTATELPESAARDRAKRRALAGYRETVLPLIPEAGRYLR